MQSSAGEFVNSSVGGHAPTIDTLRHAIATMKPHHVQHALHAGVNVNEPVDREGRTVLDAFLVEHQAMLKQLINLRASPEEKTKIFYANQHNAREILNLLMEHGAKMSSP